jgi:serine/threonine-protein kinase
LDERIATGGMGDVWKGTDVVLGRVVAVKVLRTAMLSDPEFAARFYGEARMMAAFRHPGVVEVYDYASADDTDDEQVAYLVMAYVEGEPLSNRVKQGPMGVTETMAIVAQAADALHAAHEAGTVHRDVKPGNLIVKPSGAVVLVDFGVARSAAVTSVTQANAIVGTALYMAPEQVAKGNVSPATDIYALGAVAYHCLAGHPPFDGDNALQVALRHLEDEPDPLPPHVPPAVRELIARAMAKQPTDRFQSAEEFAEAAVAAAGPLDWKKLTGTSLTAPLSPAAMAGMAGMTSLTTPMSPAPPSATRAVPLPRELLLPASAPAQSGVYTTSGSLNRRPPRSQTALLIGVVAMVVLAIGLGVAIALRPDHKPAESSSNSTTAPTAQPKDSAPTEPSLNVIPPVSTTETHSRPNGQTQRPSHTPSATAPTSKPTTTPPTTTPTTKPTTTPPTTEPTTTPPTTTPTTDPAAGTGGN